MASSPYTPSLYKRKDFLGVDEEAHFHPNRTYYFRKNVDVEEIITTCSKRLATHPEDSKALFLRGSSYFKKQQFALSLLDLDACASLIESGRAAEEVDETSASSSAECYYYRGMAYSKTDRQELAIENLTLCLDRNPGHVNAAFARAACYNTIGQFSRAIEDYNFALLKDETLKAAGGAGTPYARGRTESGSGSAKGLQVSFAASADSWESESNGGNGNATEVAAYTPRGNIGNVGSSGFIFPSQPQSQSQSLELDLGDSYNNIYNVISHPSTTPGAKSSGTDTYTGTSGIAMADPASPSRQADAIGSITPVPSPPPFVSDPNGASGSAGNNIHLDGTAKQTSTGQGQNQTQAQGATEVTDDLAILLSQAQMLYDETHGTAFGGSGTSSLGGIVGERERVMNNGNLRQSSDTADTDGSDDLGEMSVTIKTVDNSNNSNNSNNRERRIFPVPFSGAVSTASVSDSDDNDISVTVKPSAYFAPNASNTSNKSDATNTSGASGASGAYIRRAPPPAPGLGQGSPRRAPPAAPQSPKVDMDAHTLAEYYHTTGYVNM